MGQIGRRAFRGEGKTSQARRLTPRVGWQPGRGPGPRAGLGSETSSFFIRLAALALVAAFGLRAPPARAAPAVVQTLGTAFDDTRPA
ncbi:MAG TPA: hypothetical protein VEQ11_20660 [Chloroflexota bacterium]|nr:hypothetical protein [Chloroflexota bacterium]